MRHPDEGVLRQLLDEPAAVADVDREHVAHCPQCLGDLSTAREDAALVHEALSSETADAVDVDAAWQRLSGAVPDAASGRTTTRSVRSRALLRRPAVAVLAAAVVLTGAGTAAAGGWLPIFRTEQIAPVSITTSDLIALPDLSAYGDLAVPVEPDVHEVANAAAAAAESGLRVPVVQKAPRGISGEPAYQVGSKVTATFTFSAARAARAAADAGKPLPAVPPGLDGARVRLEAGPGLATVWSKQAGLPALVVARAVAPTASSSGVPLATVRDYLLSLPGLPEQVSQRLRTFTGDGSTLPLPVPADQVTTRPETVNGVPATVLTTRDQAMAAVVWVEDGVMTVVAGSLDDGEVLSVARGLR